MFYFLSLLTVIIDRLDEAYSILSFYRDLSFVAVVHIRAHFV